MEEHLRLSPSCGWATTVAIEQDIENGSYSLEDPMSEKILEARRMTFGSKWPHENKRGWTCKVQKVRTQHHLLRSARLKSSVDDRGWMALLSHFGER